MQLLAHLQNPVKKSKLADLCYALSSSPATFTKKMICDCTDPCVTPVLISTSDNLPMVTFLKAKICCLKSKANVKVLQTGTALFKK